LTLTAQTRCLHSPPPSVTQASINKHQLTAYKNDFPHAFKKAWGIIIAQKENYPHRTAKKRMNKEMYFSARNDVFPAKNAKNSRQNQTLSGTHFVKNTDILLNLKSRIL
jgi:hypothetical protein